jgi:hypothetical protein
VEEIMFIILAGKGHFGTIRSFSNICEHKCTRFR